MLNKNNNKLRTKRILVVTDYTDASQRHLCEQLWIEVNILNTQRIPQCFRYGRLYNVHTVGQKARNVETLIWSANVKNFLIKLILALPCQ